MDSTQRISERGRPQNLNHSYHVKKSRGETQIVQASADTSVQGEHKNKVAGVSSDRKASLGKYRNLLSGSELPVMTQLMSAEEGEESVARKALERPDMSQSQLEPSQTQEAKGEATSVDGDEKGKGGASLVIVPERSLKGKKKRRKNIPH